MDKSIKQQAIEHYDRMIEWVGTRDKQNRPDADEMFYWIRECWFGQFCPYCKVYFWIKNTPKCPLNETSQSECDETSCCGGLWSKMHEAKTWKTWLKYAQLVKQYIIDKG